MTALVCCPAVKMVHKILSELLPTKNYKVLRDYENLPEKVSPPFPPRPSSLKIEFPSFNLRVKSSYIEFQPSISLN